MSERAVGHKQVWMLNKNMRLFKPKTKGIIQRVLGEILGSSDIHNNGRIWVKTQDTNNTRKAVTAKRLKAVPCILILVLTMSILWLSSIYLPSEARELVGLMLDILGFTGLMVFEYLDISSKQKNLNQDLYRELEMRQTINQETRIIEAQLPSDVQEWFDTRQRDINKFICLRRFSIFIIIVGFALLAIEPFKLTFFG